MSSVVVLRAVTRHSVRRSRLRERVLVALWERGACSSRDLARLVEARESRVVAALFGDEAHRADRALVPLGLVRAVPGRWGVGFELTEVGVAEAGAVVALREAGRAV